jgi:hypothetical protein
MDTQMNPSIAPITSKDTDYGVAELRSNLRKAERRDLWEWGNALHFRLNQHILA